MTVSAIFTAAHAAARLADAVVAYRTRFTTALKSAWAAAKQTITNTMSTVLATVEKQNIGFTETYDIFHVGQQAGVTTAFAMSRPLDAEDVARFYFLTSRPASSRDNAFSTYNGVALYRQDDVKLRNLDNERTQAAYGFTAADVAAFKAAANL